jgi:phosphoesterase RecJ-like protein
LKALGKEVRILNPSPMPDRYRFLDPEGTLVEEYAEHHASLVREAEVLFLLDLSSSDRLQAMGRAATGKGTLRICIDHHPTKAASCDLAWIDDQAAATGELVFSLLKQGDGAISAAIAEALYVALMTDTGCFRYANVTAQTHLVVAELLETGIDHHGIYRHVYESNSWNQSLLFAKTIGAMQRACNDRVAWMKIPQRLFEETGTFEKDTEGLVEFPRSIGEVQVAMLFIEQAPDRIRVRFRSRSDVAIDGLARELGGGGHRNASAALLEETPLDEAVERVLALVGKYVH